MKYNFRRITYRILNLEEYMRELNRQEELWWDIYSCYEENGEFDTAQQLYASHYLQEAADLCEKRARFQESLIMQLESCEGMGRNER
jgi:hypothetical protein